MSDPISPPADVSFRPGTAADWQAVAPIVGQTRDGGSDIDRTVWERWAADKEARLVVAARSEEVVGFARLSELGPAEWWLEGLRVHPRHFDEGLIRALLAHLVDLFGQVGIGLLRFAITSKNEAVGKVAADFGFRRIISYKPMEGSTSPADYRNFKLLQASNLEMAHQYLRRSPMNRVNHFAENRWVLYYITQERLHQYLSDPRVQVLGWREFDQMHGLAIIHLPSDNSTVAPMQVSYIDAPDDTTFLAMLAALRGIATKRGFKALRWMMPLGIGLDRPAGTTDLYPASDIELWLFERPLRL